ncbi:MAG: LPS assembly lipoprotein LptE [Hyphomicrobiales bacterium]
MQRIRRVLAWFSCAAMLAVGGCGYRPLYGTAGDDRGVVAALASVSIPETDTRLGQIVRGDLLSAMRPAGTATQNRYVLVLRPEVKTASIIDKPLPSITRRSVQVVVNFELTGNEGVLHSGKTFSQVSYDVVREPFADMQAEANAMERAAHEVSMDIRSRLAAYFASH